MATQSNSKTRSRRSMGETIKKPWTDKFEGDEDRQQQDCEDSDDTMDTDIPDYDDDDDDDDQTTATAQAVEESNMQVLFSETTSREMNEIMRWWTSKAWVEDDNQANLGCTNTLLRISSSEDEGADARGTTYGSEEEQYSIEPARPLLIVLDSEDEADGLNWSLEDISDEAAVVMEPSLLGVKKEPSKSENLLAEQPNPGSVAYSSPNRGKTIGSALTDTPTEDDALCLHSDDMMDCSIRSISDADELHESVRTQNDEVTRLLFETQAMADQVASLTETSVTEDDDDCDDSHSVGSSDAEMVPKLPPRRSIRRRRRKSLIGGSEHKKPPSAEDCMKLEWHHYGQIWLFRQLMKLEILFVSEILVPLLPLSLLIRILRRPRTLRSILVASLLLMIIGLPLFVWWHFPTHSPRSRAPLPSLELFLNYEPYYASASRYSMQSCSINPVREVVFLEGEPDYGFL